MAKGFGLSNSSYNKKKSKSGKFFSELPAVKELFVIINLPTNLEIIPMKIQPSFDEMASYISLLIKPSFIDVKPFYQQIQFLSMFVENKSRSWSGFVYDASKFEISKALDLAGYLTLNTKQRHAVVKIDDINRINKAKNLPAISFSYGKSCEKLEKGLLKIFGKMPNFDEYCNFQEYILLEELKKGFEDSEVEPYYWILKIDNLDSFDINNIWGDDILDFAKGIEGFNGSSENGLRYSKAYTYDIDKEFDALLMAEYLTMRTQKNHVVMGTLENGSKDVCIKKYEYNDNLKKTHQILLDIFGKMPEYDEYVNYISELLDKEIKKVGLRI